MIPGLGRSPGEGVGNPLQYSCLEYPMDEEPGGLQSVGLKRVGHDLRHSAHMPSVGKVGRKMKVEKKLLDSCPDIDRSQSHASFLILVVWKM